VLLSPNPEVTYFGFNVEALWITGLRERTAAEVLTGSAKVGLATDPFPARMSYSTEALKRHVAENFAGDF